MALSVAKVQRSDPVSPYKWHMAQVSLRSKVTPIRSHSGSRFYQLEQNWLKATAAILSERYASQRALEKSASDLEHAVSTYAADSTEEKREQLIGSLATLISHVSRYTEAVAPTVRASLSSLRHIGIREEQDGSFTLDEERLRLMLEIDFPFVREAIAGDAGVTGRIRSDLAQIRQQPFGASISPLSFAAPNPYQGYELSQLFYQQAASQGLFFSQLF